MAIATTNPATGEVLKTFEPLSAAKIEEKIQIATSTFRSYRKTSFAERARMMVRAAEILEKEKEECGRLMTLEMGKPLRAAVAEQRQDHGHRHRGCRGRQNDRCGRRAGQYAELPRHEVHICADRQRSQHDDDGRFELRQSDKTRDAVDGRGLSNELQHGDREARLPLGADAELGEPHAERDQ